MEKYSFVNINTMFSSETIEQIKAKEERFDKKVVKSEIKKERQGKKKDVTPAKANGCMRIDQMFKKAE